MFISFIIMCIILFFMWQYYRRELDAVNRELNLIHNMAVETMTVLCTEYFVSGRFKTIDECIRFLKNHSVTFAHNGIKSLDPATIHKIAAQAKQRADK